MSEIDGTFVGQRREGAVGVELDGEMVLTVPDDDAGGEMTTHMLDETATIVWGLFDGKATLAELADDIAAAFETDLAVVLTDLIALATNLESVGLLERSTP